MAKITRETQKIFANAAANNGVFGSGQLGTKVISNDLAVLQGLAAWDSGWLDAVLGTKKFPPLEEFQSLNFINTYQLSYLFQEGVSEYDAGTTYYINSWVKKTGTNQLYASLTDTNLGNALTDPVEWKLIFDGDATVVFDLVLNYAADTGTADHIEIAPNPAITAYAAGNVVHIKPAFAITGACDIDVNAKGVKNIKLGSGADPAANAMITTGAYSLMYDGTNFVLLNPEPIVVPAASTTVAGKVELATVGETSAGTDSTRTITPAAMKGALGFSKYFESSETIISASNSYTFTHSFGVIPKLLIAELVCKTTNGNFAVGDRMPINDLRGDAAGNMGISAGYNTTQVFVSFGSSVQPMRKSAGTSFTITFSYWKLVVRAWA